MTKGFKIWLWFALVLGVLTTIMNGFYGRWPSVILAVGSIVGLCVLLFARKKWGFALMCVCYAVSFVVGVWGGIIGGTGIVLSIVMSFVGSILTPGITYLFLRTQKSL